VDKLGRRDGMSFVGTTHQGPRPAQAMLDEVLPGRISARLI
jgi:hypothetical protein